jgi:uncharacterized protein
MLWAVMCWDRENTAEVRERVIGIHREFLDRTNPSIFFSGPLLSDDAGKSFGSLFILNVKDRAAAQAFVDAEPFNQNGVFAEVRIFRMRKGRFNPMLADQP